MNIIKIVFFVADKLSTKMLQSHFGSSMELTIRSIVIPV